MCAENSRNIRDNEKTEQDKDPRHKTVDKYGVIDNFGGGTCGTGSVFAEVNCAVEAQGFIVPWEGWRVINVPTMRHLDD